MKKSVNMRKGSIMLNMELLLHLFSLLLAAWDLSLQHFINIWLLFYLKNSIKDNSVASLQPEFFFAEVSDHVFEKW